MDTSLGWPNAPLRQPSLCPSGLPLGHIPSQSLVQDGPAVAAAAADGLRTESEEVTFNRVVSLANDVKILTKY